MPDTETRTTVAKGVNANPRNPARRLGCAGTWRGGRVVECGGLENRCASLKAYRGFESLPLRSPSRDPAPRQRFHGVDPHSRHEHSQPVKARQGTRLLGWISVDPPSSTNAWVAFVRAAAHSGADRRASSLVIHLWSSKNRESRNSREILQCRCSRGLTVLELDKRRHKARPVDQIHPPFPRPGSGLFIHAICASAEAAIRSRDSTKRCR